MINPYKFKESDDVFHVVVNFHSFPCSVFLAKLKEEIYVPLKLWSERQIILRLDMIVSKVNYKNILFKDFWRLETVTRCLHRTHVFRVRALIAVLGMRFKMLRAIVVWQLARNRIDTLIHRQKILCEFLKFVIQLNLLVKCLLVSIRNISWY